MAKTLAVVGAGVIGLSIAWKAAQQGWSVTVFDPALDGVGSPAGASWVAGGMLAPVSEAWPGQERLLRLGVASLELWPAFAAALAPHAPEQAVLTARGTLLVGSTQADIDGLAPGVEWAQDKGCPNERHKSSSLRSMEQALASDLRGGWFLPSELAVDNRSLLVALRRAVGVAGAQFVPVDVARLADLSQADAVVVAAGAQAPSLLPQLAVRSVKGEILRLGRSPFAVAAPTRTIRASVRGRHVYLVPRRDGVVVGATELEGDDRPQVSAVSVSELLADAITVVPGLAEYDFLEAAAGFRPVTPDRCPLVGWTGEPSGGQRTLVATGHGRDGMLLAPLTAELALSLLEEAELDDVGREAAEAMDPARFSLG